jgi:hypothetical protein
VNDVRDTCEPDGAADRAARAARTLAAIAHDAARKHVKRDVVTPQADRDDPEMMARYRRVYDIMRAAYPPVGLDDTERERQNRLRRWQALPHPNRKGG